MAVKVLVVDDTDHVRRMLVDMLRLDGFEVSGEAASGTEAVELAASSEPDVVVMDYRMPDMDGVLTARAIREGRPSQAIILYSAFVDDEVEIRARDAGVAICLGKIEGMPYLEQHIYDLCRDVSAPDLPSPAG